MAQRRRRPGPAPRISREAVLDAARDLPPDEVTVTAISSRLGVSGPALYRYFPDRSAILDALAREARETLVPPDPSLPWDVWLREAASRVRQLWRTHVDLYQAANYRAIAGPSMEMARVGMQVLTGAGLPVVEAFCGLAAIAEIAHAIGRVEAEVEPMVDEADVAVLAEWLTVGDDRITADVLFDQGIAIAIDGLRARLPST